jgi:hypothetical protein
MKMHKIYILHIIFLFIIGIKTVNAQVEHNYPVGPQSTDCDSLDIALLSLDEAISKVENSKFRYQQQFKISRTYGVMSARYYSCNGKSGYLIMVVDKKNLIYLEVPKSVWDALITSSDINAYYKSEIEENYELVND